MAARQSSMHHRLRETIIERLRSSLLDDNAAVDAFIQQVAGHDGILNLRWKASDATDTAMDPSFDSDSIDMPGEDGDMKETTGGTDEDLDLIIKPTTTKECEFYEEAIRKVPHFAMKWMATFYGCLSVDDLPQLPASVQSTIKASHRWIVLQNLVPVSVREPRVMDVKVGTRFYDDEATEEKKLRMIANVEDSPSKRYGIRITGMNVLKQKYTRQYGKAMRSQEQLVEAVADYLGDSNANGANNFLKELEAFEYALVQIKRQHSARLYSASLLWVYDAQQPNVYQLKLIDMAHSYLHPPALSSLDDTEDGFLFGVKTLKAILKLLSEK
jgi:hypothetical protein